MPSNEIIFGGKLDYISIYIYGINATLQGSGYFNKTSGT